MPTLYELLGALPQDDAESLRAAFRRAARTSHPDNNPGDDDAPYRFRQVVRAYSILRDEKQRATYDELLSDAEHERAPDSRRKVFAELGLPGPFTSMVIASVAIGAFMVLERVLTAPVVLAQVQMLSERAMALTAAMPTHEPGTVGKANDRVSARDKPDRIAPVKEADIASAVEELATPAVVATLNDRHSVPEMSEPEMSEPVISEAPMSAPVVKDANYYLERGNLAYRSGDFPLALTDFDLAINLDPNSSDAYINRAIVLRRLGDLRRAFADVGQARRIDERKAR